MKVSSRFLFLIAILIAVLDPVQTAATGKLKSGNSIAGISGTASPITWAKRVKQGYTMRVWLSNQLVMGEEAWDPFTPPVENCAVGLGLEYAAGACIEHLFGAGPWIGAKINGRRLVDEGYNGDDARFEFETERKDTARDRIWHTAVGRNFSENGGYGGYYANRNIIVNRKGVDDDGDGTIDEDELDGLDNDGDWSRDPITHDWLYDSRGQLLDDIGADGLPDSLEAGCTGGYDSIANPDPAFDNYDPFGYDKCHFDASGNYLRKSDRNRYTQNNRIPDHGEPHVDEDYGAVSDNDYYMAATDTFRTFQISGHVPMGAKIFQKSYAWKSGTSADAMTFIDDSFVNIGGNQLQDVYLAMFADMDVGPVDIFNYVGHNYAAYDSGTHTAYIQNPIDRGSTPLGITFLGASRPLDSLKSIFQYFGFAEPGTIDSVIYSWISGDAFPDQLIRPDQSPTNVSDARFLISNGPFQMLPGETVKATYAYVSGLTIEEMLNNARRAHRIYESNYFIAPVAHIIDSGATNSTTISWDASEPSPYGSVTSYRVYYGQHSGQYTDSIITSNHLVQVSGFTFGQSYFFAVAAIDDRGNRSALSDELTNSPSSPREVTVIDQQKAIQVEWARNTDPDLAGYTIYRHTSADPSESKLNSSFLSTPTYLDTAVWGDRTYYYRITATDHDGHESAFSNEISGHLIPPAVPSNFIVGPGKSFLHLNWSPNADRDLAGYNIFRSQSQDTGFVHLNDALWHTSDFIDSSVAQDTVYYYRLDAVDLTDAISGFTASVMSHTVRRDQGILVENQWRVSGPFPPYATPDSARVFYQGLLNGTRNTIRDNPYPGTPLLLGQYSTVLVFFEVPLGQFVLYDQPEYPAALKAYVLGGGKLLVSGRKLTANAFPYWYQFLRDIFGVDLLIETNSTTNFIGATGYDGFPSVTVDPAKGALSPGGVINYVERFPGASTERVLYSMHSNPIDSLADGKPVGLRALDPSLGAYYLSFPLYYLDSTSAGALLQRVLRDFGEVTGVLENHSEGPHGFKLYEAYPNPFNPMTRIRFDIPRTGFVSLKIFNVLGQEVATLVNEVRNPGEFQAEWIAGGFPSGVYFYRLDAGPSSDVKKLLLLK